MKLRAQDRLTKPCRVEHFIRTFPVNLKPTQHVISITSMSPSIELRTGSAYTPVRDLVVKLVKAKDKGKISPCSRNENMYSKIAAFFLSSRANARDLVVESGKAKDKLKISRSARNDKTARYDVSDGRLF